MRATLSATASEDVESWRSWKPKWQLFRPMFFHIVVVINTCFLNIVTVESKLPTRRRATSTLLSSTKNNRIFAYYHPSALPSRVSLRSSFSQRKNITSSTRKNVNKSLVKRENTITTLNMQEETGKMSSPSNTNTGYFAGFDFGTSGARLSIIKKGQTHDNNNNNINRCFEEVFSSSILWSPSSSSSTISSASSSTTQVVGTYDDPGAWIRALDVLLKNASNSNVIPNLPRHVKSICISGTSASCVLVNKNREDTAKAPSLSREVNLEKARMYNYNVLDGIIPGEVDSNGKKALELLKEYAPPNHTTLAPTSSLAKLLKWQMETPLNMEQETLTHQADYIVMYLTQQEDSFKKHSTTDYATFSDWHNCLKLGYDVRKLEWPKWLLDLLRDTRSKIKNKLDDDGIYNQILPNRVVSPGTVIGTVSSVVSDKYGLSPNTMIVGGTTDSNAAFFAATDGSGLFPMMDDNGSSGGNDDNDSNVAVTSLGSTLAIKQLSDTYVEDSKLGVYSHRFPEPNSSLPTSSDNIVSSNTRWLIGGASNVGCAILRQEGFTSQELETLSQAINPNVDSPLQYYPLTQQGERFPVADSTKQPCLEPKPPLEKGTILDSKHKKEDAGDDERKGKCEEGEAVIYDYDRKEYLHGILQGIAQVECDGYRALQDLRYEELEGKHNRDNDKGDRILGSLSPTTFPKIIYSCGGGSKNNMWTQMRQRMINRALKSLDEGPGSEAIDDDRQKKTDIKVMRASQTEASYGAALLAAAGFFSSAPKE